MKIFLVKSESKLPDIKMSGNYEFEDGIEVFSNREDAEWYVCNVNNDAEIIEYELDSYNKNNENVYLIVTEKPFDKPFNVDYSIFFQTKVYQEFVDADYEILKIKKEISNYGEKYSLIVKARTMKEAINSAIPIIKKAFEGEERKI